MSTSKQMGWRFGFRSVCSCVAMLAAGALPLVAQAQTPPPPSTAAPAVQKVEKRESESAVHVIASESKLSLIQLETKILEFSTRIDVVDAFNPEVLNVTAVSPTQIRLRAETTGVTEMTVTDENGAKYHIEVFVEGDVRELKAYLNRLFPGSAVDVISLRDSVVLRGWVTEPSAIPQIIAIAKQMYPTVHNQMSVGGVNVVQLHVKIIEVQRSKLKQLGFNFVASGQQYAVAQTVGGLAPLSAMSVPFGGPPVPSVTASSLATLPLQFAVTGTTDRFQGFIDALTTEALAKTLAEPTLVTTSGRPASLLSGGEFPILIPSGLGTVSVQFKQFGVQMEAIPTVLGNGRLRLDVAPEVSERDFSSAVNISGYVVPGVNTRRVNTQVEMNFGETVMIGGLISQRRVVSSGKIPILGELPILGAFFSRKSSEIGETELLIMVTPELAAPMRRDQVPLNAPGWMQDEATSKELFLDGMLEVPSYGEACEGCQPGMFGEMSSGSHMPGPVYSGNANCAPPEIASPDISIELAPTQEQPIVPTDVPAQVIQPISGRSGQQSVIQAGGDPYRVPTRREIPDSTQRKSASNRTGSSLKSSSTIDAESDSQSSAGLIGPQRSNAARPTGRTKSIAPRPENVRGLAP